MYHSVAGICQNHVATWSGHVGFSKAVADLGAALEKLGSLATNQSSSTAGVTAAKAAARAALAAQASVIAGALVAYAADGGPESLKEWEGVTESDFTQGRQTEALRKVDRIFEAATPVSTALADYGVTAERLAALKTGRDAFADLASAPRQKASARSGDGSDGEDGTGTTGTPPASPTPSA